MFSCSLIPKEVITQFGPGAVTLQVVAGGNAFGQVKFWSSDVIRFVVIGVRSIQGLFEKNMISNSSCWTDL